MVAVTENQHIEAGESEAKAACFPIPWSLLALLCLIAAAVVRIPFWPDTLFSEDCFNFAQALQKFDPRNLVPQPPGYPLFVLQSQALQTVFGTAERTFLAGVVAGTAAALFLSALLGWEMTRSRQGALLAWLLFAASPTFWFAGLTSTIRIYIAVVTLAVVLFCWRLWWGDRRWWWAAALALGLGSGYRPELLPALLPLWAVATWRGVPDPPGRLRAAAVLLGGFAVWFIYLYSHFEDWRAFWLVQTDYLENQSEDFSLVYGARVEGWLRMLCKFVAWYAVPAMGWIAFLPFARARLAPGARSVLVLAIAPLAVFHLLVHLGAPDHAVGQTALLAIIGGAVLANLTLRYPDLRWLAAGAALAVGVVFFLYPPSIGKPVPPARIASNLAKQLSDALWENSWPAFQTVEERSSQTMAAVRKILREAPQGTLVVWNRSPLAWRKLSYYEPQLPLLLLLDLNETGNLPHAALWRNLRLEKRWTGTPVEVPLGSAERILWVLGEHSPIPKQMGGRLLPVGPWVFLSDAAPLELAGYRFVRD